MKALNRFKKSYLLYSFKRDPIAILSFIVLSVLVVISLLAPVVAPYDTYDTSTIDIMDAETPPSWMEEGNKNFILGTDSPADCQPEKAVRNQSACASGGLGVGGSNPLAPTNFLINDDVSRAIR